MDNVGGIWGVAQSTNCSTLINACLPLVSNNIPQLLKLKLNAEQLEDVFQLPSIKGIGGERQMHLIASWMDTEYATADQVNPVDQLNSLLSLVDLKSINDASFLNFLSEDHVILANQECR